MKLLISKKIVSFNYKTFAVEKNYLNSKTYFVIIC